MTRENKIKQAEEAIKYEQGKIATIKSIEPGWLYYIKSYHGGELLCNYLDCLTFGIKVRIFASTKYCWNGQVPTEEHIGYTDITEIRKVKKSEVPIYIGWHTSSNFEKLLKGRVRLKYAEE